MDECVNTNDVTQLKFVRRFLTDFRGNFNEYGKEMLQHQTISNVIHLLHDEIKSNDDSYCGDDN